MPKALKEPVVQAEFKHTWDKKNIDCSFGDRVARPQWRGTVVLDLKQHSVSLKVSVLCGVSKEFFFNGSVPL